MNGIWKYASQYTYEIDESSRITLGEGETPLEVNENISNALKINELLIKREDLNPSGSHKDRSVCYMLSYYAGEGYKEFVISSSGNTAISAISYANKAENITLDLFLSKSLSSEKRLRLEKALGFEIGAGFAQVIHDKFKIFFGDKPLSDAIKYANENKLLLLRGSTDDIALEGFKSIAFELFEQAEEATDIFVPTSSGTTAEGIYLGYKQLLEQEKITQIPRIHIVQTTKVNPMAREFDKEFEDSETSLSDCIVDRVAHRRKQILDIVRETKGSGWVISDEHIKDILNVTKSSQLRLSNEGALCLAAIQKAKSKGLKMPKPIAIITGTK